MHEELRSKAFSVALTGADQVALSRNSVRSRLVVSSPDLGRVAVVFGEPATANMGVVLAAGNSPYTFALTECGCDLREDVHLFGSGGATVVGLMEFVRVGEYGPDPGDDSYQRR